VAADRHQAAADEGYLGGGVELEQLPERVEQQYLVLARRGGLRAARVADLCLLERLRHLRKARRMARRQH
jgi:hypothetical protein